MDLQQELKRLQGRPLCGENGRLQCSGWIALDMGLTFEQWVKEVQAAPHPGALPTMRIQFRKMEADRNACLVEDGDEHLQTFYGKRVTP